MKIVFSDPKSGRTAQIEVKADAAAVLMNRKIGEIVEGAALGLAGYKLKITGGSDKSGFPMDKSIEGTAKAKVLRKVSMTGRHKGQHMRQSKRGALVSMDTEQVNTVIVEQGEKPFDEIFPKKEKAAKAEKAEKAEKPKEEKKAGKK